MIKERGGNGTIVISPSFFLVHPHFAGSLYQRKKNSPSAVPASVSSKLHTCDISLRMFYLACFQTGHLATSLLSVICFANVQSNL